MLIRSTTERVFDAFVNPVTITQLWPAKTSAPLTLDATVQWEFMVPGAKETDKVTRPASPNQLVALTWSDGINVDMKLAAHGKDATVLSVVASGFAGAAEAVAATEEFSIVLRDPKALLRAAVQRTWCATKRS